MSEVVVILGAAGGLGSAITQAYAARGARLVLTARNVDRLQALAESFNTEVLTLAADITRAADVEAVNRACIEHFGRVDVVINAAGYDVRRAFLDHSTAEIEQLVSIDLLGAVWVTRAFLPQMLAQHSGVIAHLGGFADGRLAFPFYTVDSAARAGVRGFVDAVNREYDGSGVTLTYFCPAPADTEAERPYHALWRAMGTSIVPPEQVAHALVKAVADHKRVVVMGATTRLFAWINSLSSELADRLLMRRYRDLIRDYLVQIASHGGALKEQCSRAQSPPQPPRHDLAR